MTQIMIFLINDDWINYSVAISVTFDKDAAMPPICLMDEL